MSTTVIEQLKTLQVSEHIERLVTMLKGDEAPEGSGGHEDSNEETANPIVDGEDEDSGIEEV